MQTELAKAYEPKEVEGRIYDFWQKGGFFHAEADPAKKPYTIMMPPPNITDKLHVGHAMTMTTQDGHRPRRPGHRSENCRGHAQGGD